MQDEMSEGVMYKRSRSWIEQRFPANVHDDSKFELRAIF
jgi:hypothetical protein